MKIQVLERCFLLLDLLRDHPLTLSELAAMTGVQATTLRNILRTLEELDVVGRDGKKYTLGPKLNELALPLDPRARLLPLARAAAQEIAARTGEQATVSMLREANGLAPTLEVLALEVPATNRSSHQLDVSNSQEGGALAVEPLDCLEGRLLLANAAPQQWQATVDRAGQAISLLEPLRGQAMTTEQDAAKQVVRFVRLVLDSTDSALAALSVTLPIHRFDALHQKSIEIALDEAASALEKNLVPPDVAEKLPAATRPTTASPKRPMPREVENRGRETPKTAMDIPEVAPPATPRRSWAGFRN